MKNLITILFCFVGVALYAQDTTKVAQVKTDITIATKNVWRGVNYGNNTPMVQGTLALNFKNAVEVGACGTATINGDRKGYGNWMELYTTYTIDRFSLTIDDYYFFSYDSLNDYFNYSKNTTQHLVEARLKYNIEKKFSVFASYNIYANVNAQKAWYFEAEYFVRPDLSLLFGAVTGASWLNYYDAGGITTIGVAGSRDIEVTKTFKIPVKASLIFNPNYRNIAKWDGSGYIDPGYNGLGRNPVNFVISISL